MRAGCVQAIAAALKRAPTEAEVKDIESRMVKAMRRSATRDPAAWAGKSNADRLNEAARDAAAESVAEATLKRKRTVLQALATDRLLAHISRQAARGIGGLEALDRTIAFSADAKSDFLSVESQSHAIKADAIRQMIGTLEASNPKWFGLYENRDGIIAITKEIFGEDSGNADARAGAKEWKSVTTALRERFNRAGGDIGTLDDWGLPHHHSQRKVAAVGRDQWVADTLPALKRESYVNEDGSRMSDEQLKAFLGESWTTIATGGANKVTPGQFQGGGARANRGSAERQIHFKDAESYLAYQQKYGESSAYEVLTRHIEGISKDVALVETYGPNPDQAFRFLRDKTVQEAKLADPTRVGEIDKKAVATENLYNEVAGKRLPVASKHLAESFDTLRSWLIASRLGSAIISSFSDEGTLYLTSKVNQLPAMRLFANELATMNPANRMELRMARRAGLALNSLIASLNRFGQDGLGTNFSSKLANTVMRVQGLNAITEARKRAFGVTMMGSLGGVVKEHPNLAALDPNDFRILKSKGLNEQDFAIWKKSQLEDWGSGNTTMLTPDAIYRIDNQSLDHILSPELAKVRDAAQKEIDGINAARAKDQASFAKRSSDLSTWLKEEMDRVDGILAKTKDLADAKKQAIMSQISRLQERIDYAANVWRDNGSDAPGIDSSQRASLYGKQKLRSLGVDEGRAVESIKALTAQIDEIARTTQKNKAELIGYIYPPFNQLRTELEDFGKRVAERDAKRSAVVDRITREIEPTLQATRDRAREQAVTKLLGIVHEESNMAVIEPGARERAITGGQTQRGTLKGELTRSFFLFKSFPLAMIMRHWARGMSQPNRGGRAAYVAALIASTTVAGVASLQIGEMLSGRDPRNLNPAGNGGIRNWIAALLKGGSFGIYGDLLFANETRYGGGPVATLMGPVVGLGEDAYNLTQGNAVQYLRGEPTNIGAESVRFARSNLPAGSLWYTKAALDHMIFHQLQEYFSPGYLANMRARAERDYGQKYWWEPGQVVPNRAPDLGAMAGK